MFICMGQWVADKDLKGSYEGVMVVIGLQLGPQKCAGCGKTRQWKEQGMGEKIFSSGENT